MLISFGVNLDFCPRFVSRMQNAIFNFIPDIIRAETSQQITRLVKYMHKNQRFRKIVFFFEQINTVLSDKKSLKRFLLYF